MIGLEGGYLLTISVAQYKDFIDPTELKELIISEVGGNILPYFELRFKSEEEGIISKLNDGHSIDIQFGETRDSMVPISLVGKKLSYSRESISEYLIEVKGFLAQGKYLSNSSIQSVQGTSISAARSIISKYFKPMISVGNTNDSMTWVNPNQSDRKFVTDILMHSYIPNSFLSFAVTADNRFIIKDMVNEIKTKKDNPDWILGQATERRDQLKAVPYLSNYDVLNDSGVTNELSAYKNEMQIFNMNTGADAALTGESRTLMALSRQVAKNAEVEKKYNGAYALSGNTHPNYWRGYQQNLIGNMSLHGVRVGITIREGLKTFRPLDIVRFQDFSSEDSNQANEYTTGLYVISKVQKKIVDLKCITYLEICREAMNEVRNAT